MKDIYKNPTFYYLLVPVVMAIWPLLLWFVYMPEAENKWDTEKTQYEDAQKVIAEILSIDPDRLDFGDPNAAPADFDYANAVEKIASLCGIQSTSYKLSSGRIMKSSGQKSQTADVSLEQIGIKKFAEFLSSIQIRWASLQCEKATLTKKKGLPDIWDADMRFKYYY